MPLQKWLHYSSLRCRNQHGRPLNVLLNNSKPQYVPFISPIICHHISQPSFIFPAGNTHLCSSSGRREKGVKVNQYKFKGIVCPGVIYSFWWCFKPALGKKKKKTCWLLFYIQLQWMWTFKLEKGLRSTMKET